MVLAERTQFSLPIAVSQNEPKFGSRLRFWQNEPNDRAYRVRDRGWQCDGGRVQDTRTYGIATSANYRVSPDTLLGGTGLSLANGLGSGSADLFQAGAYARRNIGAASTGPTLVYDVTTSRAGGAKPAECWPCSQ